MMIDSVSENLENLGAKRFLCAVSGGMDSMCLLHLTLQWAGAHGCEVRAAHFNHELRGEQADRDEAFVREICAAWGVPCAFGRGDTRQLAKRQHLTLEEAARRLRYQFLEQTAQDQDCPVILTAHHAEDNAETMLLNLVRGTGIRGLAGIPPTRGRIARVLLDVSREELEAYAKEQRIPWVIDETNYDPDAASRNLLRWKVLPVLREINPRAVHHMGDTADELWEINRMLDRRIQWLTRQETSVSEKGVSISLEVLDRAAEPVEAGILLNLFDLLGVGRKDIGRTHLWALASLVERGRGRIDLPHGVTARCVGGWLRLEQSPERPDRRTLEPGVPLDWGPWTLTLLDRPAGEGLSLRGEGAVEVGPCPAGDRLQLDPDRGGRTVKRLCLDRGVSLESRETLPALYVEGQLAAVWQLGVDVRYAPAEQPVRFIQITKKSKENDHEK